MSAPGQAVRCTEPRRYTRYGASPSPSTASPANKQVTADDSMDYRAKMIRDALRADRIEVGLTTEEGLRKLAWGGFETASRADGWRLLLDYMPSQRSRQELELKRKRQEYFDYVSSYFEKSAAIEQGIVHQLSIDLPRHKMALFHDNRLVKRLNRMLFMWSIRHPAVGYVQGMDDISVIFFIVLVARSLGVNAEEVCTNDGKRLAKLLDTADTARLEEAEADCYWCAGRFLSWVQDHFVANQPRVKKLLADLETVMQRVDEPLLIELEKMGIRFVEFAFQWVHCLLVRELPTPLAIRLWDTYLSIGTSFSEFHVFVCAAMIGELRPSISGVTMDVVIKALQNPDKHLPMDAAWLETLIARAYVLKLQYGDCLA